MALNKIVEFCFPQIGLDAADQHGREFIADFWHQDCDAVGPFALQISGKKIRAILKLFDSFPNPYLRRVGYCARVWRVAEDNRDSGRRNPRYSAMNFRVTRCPWPLTRFWRGNIKVISIQISGHSVIDPLHSVQQFAVISSNSSPTPNSNTRLTICLKQSRYRLHGAAPFHPRVSNCNKALPQALLAYEEGFCQRLRSDFERDLTRSECISLERWRHRSVFSRAPELLGWVWIFDFAGGRLSGH